MSPCLVQQIFRQKIGKELDQSIVDEVLFPLLRSRKHPSKDLLLDIKMTQRWDEHGDSMITRPGLRFPRLTEQQHALVGRYSLEKNMSPFTRIPPPLESVRAAARRAVAGWRRHPRHARQQESKERKRLGKVNSRFRREMTIREKWGTVDILNELRELKHPVIECHPVPDEQRHFDLAESWGDQALSFFLESMDDAYIHLEETKREARGKIVIAVCDFWGYWSKSPLYSNDQMLLGKEKAIIKEDLQFVNRYLEHSLSNGGLYWVTQTVGEPDRFASAPSLSTYY